MKGATLTALALRAATTDQLAALATLVERNTTEAIDVQEGGFGLPEGYLAFRLDYTSGGSPLYGGIDPEGSVST